MAEFTIPAHGEICWRELTTQNVDKAKEFLKVHTELQAYLIYSDEKGNYQVYETPGLKSFVTEAEE